MAATTATWAIPYPQSTDQFCDGWLFTQEMAERVDAILDDFDTDLTFVEFPPMARVTLTANEVVDAAGSGGAVTFDQVDWDTDSWVNLSANGKAIITTGARYIVTGGATGMISSISAADEYQLTVNGATTSSRDASVNAWTSVSALDSGVATIQMNLSHLGSAVTNLTALANARMYAFWFGNQ